jgi:nucleoside-diphosphate-sugar epimerase
MKRILLTGGTGFVGACLARRLIQDGHELHLLARNGFAAWRLTDIQHHIHLYDVNLTHHNAVEGAVEAIRPDWIFHLAAYGAYSSQTDVRRIFETNLMGTLNLVEACLKIGFESFVNTGSSSEYGFKDHAPTDREWIDPNSYYALFKAGATQYCRFTAQHKKVHLPTLRLYSVYGPYEEPTRLIPTVITRGLEGAYPPLVNPGIARDYIFSEDVNDAYILAATQPNQEPGAVYNIGSGVQTSLREVVEVAGQTLNIQAAPAWGSMPDRGWDTTIWVADSSKAQHDLGWQPRYTFAAGFAETVNWFRANPAMERYYRENRALPK